jgi:hypothetical protein
VLWVAKLYKALQGTHHVLQVAKNALLLVVVCHVVACAEGRSGRRQVENVL